MSAQALGPDKAGQWGNTFNLLNVPVHASLLPTGKVLYWGRRWNFDANDTMPTAMKISTLDMNQQTTKTFLWTPPKMDDPKDLTGRSAPTATQPKSLANQDVNLFCSGHAFQPDGTLLVVGSGATRVGYARGSIKRLLAARAHLLGVVLTKFETRSSGSYGYGYGYGEGSYYGGKSLARS